MLAFLLSSLNKKDASAYQPFVSGIQDPAGVYDANEVVKILNLCHLDLPISFCEKIFESMQAPPQGDSAANAISDHQHLSVAKHEFQKLVFSINLHPETRKQAFAAAGKQLSALIECGGFKSAAAFTTGLEQLKILLSEKPPAPVEKQNQQPLKETIKTLKKLLPHDKPIPASPASSVPVAVYEKIKLNDADYKGLWVQMLNKVLETASAHQKVNALAQQERRS